MTGDGRKRGQHHGDAREALLCAAAASLETTGAAHLSLRGIAERAGLSRQAPYNHFTDKEAMLANLVVAGFESLIHAMEAASGALAGEAALGAAGEAYIAFAQATPARFRLMFACERIDHGRFPAIAAAETRAFAVLRAIVGTMAPPARVEAISLTAWCIVHGYATLCIETGIETAGRRAERAREFARTIAAAAG